MKKNVKQCVRHIIFNEEKLIALTLYIIFITKFKNYKVSLKNIENIIKNSIAPKY